MSWNPLPKPWECMMLDGGSSSSKDTAVVSTSNHKSKKRKQNKGKESSTSCEDNDEKEFALSLENLSLNATLRIYVDKQESSSSKDTAVICMLDA